MADVRSRNPTGDSYRPEIDGLRALAVIAVMLYHTEHTWFRAGYLGVDIFFAISGFLITGIIVERAAAGRFSLAEFYMRRIRRIIPALAVMCLLTLPIAIMLMLPEDLENFGQSLFATALSANNILLYVTSGYFSQETGFKPLFHTWSLGVEEQYYLLAPLLLMLAIRHGGRRGALVALAICSLASFLGAELLRQFYSTNANFLLLPSRIWELGIGGMACLAQPMLLRRLQSREQLRRSLVYIGLGLMFASFIILANVYDLPGWQTLLPLSGTLLVLMLGSPHGPGRLLAWPPVVGIGLISFSAYLYHIPVYAFVRLTQLSEPPPALLLATIPLCLLLAWLSWRFVEVPFRDPKRISNRRVLYFAGAGLGTMAAGGLMLHLTSGFFSASALASNDPQMRRGMTALYNDAPYAYQGRPLPGEGSKLRVLVLGNSFARDFINMGLETGALREVALSYQFHSNCDKMPASLIARARMADAVIFGSGATGWDAACLIKKVREVEAVGVPHVVVLGLKQFGYNNNAVMLLPPAERYAYRARPLRKYYNPGIAARPIIPARYFVDLFAILDDGTGTVPVFTPDRKFISQDTRHLTKAGARFLGEKVFAQPQFSWLGWRPGRSQRDPASGNQPFADQAPVNLAPVNQPS